VIGSSLVNRTQASPNIEPRFDGKRVKTVVLHYTGMPSGQLAVEWLCNPASKVSCHYLVDADGTIVQMVDETMRAWHAGVSSWHGEIDVNSTSIGIEIQNPGHSAGSPAFPLPQMQRVAALTLDIMMRHGLHPSDVVAHSDIAPGRKVDPGEVFDWDYLAHHGVGQTTKAGSGAVMTFLDMQSALQKLGYGIDSTGVGDEQTRTVLRAFQRRYRRNLVNGEADMETQHLLSRLITMI
jgi:N-acetylmuramoyl-L-alanine amidase